MMRQVLKRWFASLYHMAFPEPRRTFPENESGITPTGDLVLMLCPPVQSVTAGGIHIPEEARERQAKATRIGYLLDMGEGAKVHPRTQGLVYMDMCLIPRYAADFVPIN